jgi:hypothetical protein
LINLDCPLKFFNLHFFTLIAGNSFSASSFFVKNAKLTRKIMRIIVAVLLVFFSKSPAFAQTNNQKPADNSKPLVLRVVDEIQQRNEKQKCESLFSLSAAGRPRNNFTSSNFQRI